VEGGEAERARAAQPGEKKAQRDLIHGYEHLMEGVKMMGLFSVVPSSRTRGNGCNRNARNFYLNVRKNFFYSSSGQTLDQVA